MTKTLFFTIFATLAMLSIGQRVTIITPNQDPDVDAPQDPAVDAPQDPNVAAQDPAVAAPQDPAVVTPQDPAVVAPQDPAVVAPQEPIVNRPPIRTTLDGITHTPSTDEWSCSVNFFSNGVLVAEEAFGPNRIDAVGNEFAVNNIGEITWQGAFCQCWVFLYENADYDGHNLGLWVSGNQGRYDLSNYIVEDSINISNLPDDTTNIDTDDLTDWVQWNAAVSSYRIFCH